MGNRGLNTSRLIGGNENQVCMETRQNKWRYENQVCMETRQNKWRYVNQVCMKQDKTNGYM
jgi:hypothetical protein